MQTPLQRILRGVFVLLVTSVLGVTGYMLAGWSLLDSIYMVVITVYGVGYGEVGQMDPQLRIFTMLIILFGCSSAIYVVGGFVQMLAEGEINRAMGARRMNKGIEQLRNHVIICGYGRVGQYLARELADAKVPFVVVDTDMGPLSEAEAAGYLIAVGNATEDATLLGAGIKHAKVLACVLSDDTLNVFITLTGRELNGEIDIIARAEIPSTEKKLRRSGANRVVMPASIGGSKIAQLITNPSAETLLTDAAGKSHLDEELKTIGLHLSEFVVDAQSQLVGQQLSTVEVAGRGGFIIVALRRYDGTVVCNPPDTTPLAAGDAIVLIGRKEDVMRVARKVEARSVTTYRGAKN